jgi:hypothetical protein
MNKLHLKYLLHVSLSLLLLSCTTNEHEKDRSQTQELNKEAEKHIDKNNRVASKKDIESDTFKDGGKRLLGKDAQKRIINKLVARSASVAKETDMSKIPTQLKKLIRHTAKLNQLTRDNLPNCKRTEDAINNYLKNSRSELDQLSKVIHGSSKDDKMIMGKQLLALSAPIIEETLTVYFEFYNNCPNEHRNVLKSIKGLNLSLQYGN